MNSESWFWHTLQSRFGRYAQRIENRVGVGMPDILLTYPVNQIVFLELKVGTSSHDVSRGYRVCLHNIRPAQKIWHRNYAAIGGKSFIAARTDNRIFLFQSYPYSNWPGPIEEPFFFEDIAELFPNSWSFDLNLERSFPDLLSKMISDVK